MKLARALRTLGLVVIAAAALDCAGAGPSQTTPPTPTSTAPAAPVLLVRPVPPATDELTEFPAPAEGRRDRPPLPAEYARAGRNELRLSYPVLDVDEDLVIDGTSISFTFDQPVRGATPGAPAGGHVRIEPPVAGTARWSDERTLVFTATRLIDPASRHTLALTDIEATSGARLGAFERTLRSVVGAVIAGKTLGYVPVIGEPRVVTVLPWSGNRIGRRHRMEVLYDQPVDLALGASLVALRDAHGKPIDVLLGHPAIDSFDGVAVDRRFVVTVSPRQSLAHGEKVALEARHHAPVDGNAGETVSLTVAEPLAFTDAACGWWLPTGDNCDFAQGVLRTSRSEVHLRFNNLVTRKGMAGRVQVTPRPGNLMVAADGYDDDGRIVITGAFRPSTRYRIRAVGLRDRFGQILAQPVDLGLETMPLGASVAMPEGLLLLDQQHTRRFTVSSRNVAAAALSLWRLPDGDGEAYARALRELGGGRSERGAPTAVVDIAVKPRRDEIVDTEIDLSQKLAPGVSYLARLEPAAMAFGAQPLAFTPDAPASRPPLAVLQAGRPESLAVHAHSTRSATLVQVARLASGEPVAGARVSVGANAPAATTDANGVALLVGDYSAASADLLLVAAGAERLTLPLSELRAHATTLFPTLGGELAGQWQRRGLVATDRGIYRPGATIGVAAHWFRAAGTQLTAVSGQAVRLRVLDPHGRAVCSEDRTTSAVGGASAECPLSRDAGLGPYRVLLDEPGADAQPIAETAVRVAAFEPPRFVVDVAGSAAGDGTAAARLGATVVGRYLFGATLGGAAVSWTLRARDAELPAGPLSDAGLWFGAGREPWEQWEDERPSDGTRVVRTGSGRLDEAGKLALEELVPLADAVGPVELSLEAEVSDESLRSAAGRAAFVVNPAARYAGLKAPRGWVDGDEVEVELGVADRMGAAVSGVPVSAELGRVIWRQERQRGPGGALQSDWRRTIQPVARCQEQSAARPVRCTLRVPTSGSYQVTAQVDGRAGGSSPFYAWLGGPASASAEPLARGNVVALLSDKARYRPGDTARLLVRNPYPEALAILTVEGGGLRSHQSQRVRGAAGLFTVAIAAEHAPFVNATVTLLPIGATGRDRASYRIGALKLPVDRDGTRLAVAASPDRPSYRPGEQATVKVSVMQGGRPRAGAEVTLAIVDEGVLRLTGHRVVDPATALYPGYPLDMVVRDTRTTLAELSERSQIAGDGDGGGSETAGITHARRRFVQTALFKPGLVADESGTVEASLELPDNLTEFRVMAFAVDRDGHGGAGEASFVVHKPLLLEPLLPRFAMVGDRFEAGAMLHNNGDAPFEGVVRIAGEELPVRVAARGRARMTVPMSPRRAGLSTFVMSVVGADGSEQDRVEAPLAVGLPGLEARPRTTGSFAGEKRIALRIPADALIDEGAALEVKAGQQLWPELGARLEYLLEYPHGCVEQTTSSTLPLLAARDILPRIGIDRYGEAFLRERIEAGLGRLATMRTPSGALAYWPGGSEPSIYGTAYAMLAVVRAKQAGIEPPAGLLEGMSSALATALAARDAPADVLLAISESLSELGQLPASRSDALFELGEQASVFGRASLALALSRLGGQADRVARLLDGIEAAVEHGHVRETIGSDAWRHFASSTRTEAQVAIALARLRPGSLALPALVTRLASGLEGYTTQATAYSLLGVAEQLRRLPDAGAAVTVALDGQPVSTRTLGAGAGVLASIPLASLRGRKAELLLGAAPGVAIGYMLSARYRIPFVTGSGAAHPEAGALCETSAAHGPAVYRFITDPVGRPIDLGHVKAGELLRVAVLVRLADVPVRERHYLAVTDALPAGFEAVDTTLATVASAAELQPVHPLYELLSWSRSQASHLELGDDRVAMYLDEPAAQEVALSYLVRATTVGDFVLPPTVAELMYQADSTGYGEARRVTVQ